MSKGGPISESRTPLNRSDVDVTRRVEPEPTVSSWQRRIRLSAAVIALGFAEACQTNSDLAAELRTRDVQEGLAVIRTRFPSNWFEIVSFDRGEYSVPNPRGLSSVWIAQGDDLVAWNVPRQPVAQPCDGLTTIETMGGESVRQLPGRILYLQTMAVSADGHRVAFEGTYIPAAKTAPANHDRLFREGGIHYLDIQAGTALTISTVSNPSEDSTEISWSPGGDAFTYTSGNRIYIFDVSTGASQAIAYGQNPTWSADGQWLAFRSSDGWATAINPVTHVSKRLLPDHKILGAVHWSPDSQYVLVSEAVGVISNILRWRSPGGPSSGELVVYRLRDGAGASVGSISLKGGNDRGFEWVKDLRVFMKGASKGTPTQLCSP